MFEANVDGNTYKVVFQYAEQQPFLTPVEGKLVVRDGIYAHVLMYTGVDNEGKKQWQAMFSGFAAKNPNLARVGTKNSGRKVALSRALDQSGFSKRIRSQFWEAYFESRGKVN